MKTFPLAAYNNVPFRWTLDLNDLADFFVAGGKLRMVGKLSNDTSYTWLQDATDGGIITVSVIGGRYVGVFTAPLRDTRNFYGKMSFDCRGELPNNASEPIFGGTINFRQGIARVAGDESWTAVTGIPDTVDGGGPLFNPIDFATAAAMATQLAQDWATKTSGEVVPGQGYGAKKYALDAQATAAALGGYTAYRNRIMNGNFDVWQRGTTYTVANNSALKVADRWYAVNNITWGASATVTRVTAPSGFRGVSAMRMTSTGAAASGSFDFMQRFEGSQISDFDGANAVVSFDVAASTSAGSISCQLVVYKFNSLDNTGSLTLLAVKSVSISGSGTAEKKTVALTTSETAGLRNGGQLMIRFVQNTSPGNVDVTIGAVQFELDRQISSAWGNPTPFEFRPYSVELLMCLRYYWRCLPVPALNFSSYVVGAICSWAMSHPVRMRVNPTMTLSAPGITTAGCNTPVINSTNTDGYRIYSTSTAVSANCTITFGAGDYVEANAEL